MSSKRPLTFVLSALLLAGTGIASAQYYQGPPPPPHYDHDWEAPPPEFAAAERRGFHDGIEGARKDFDNHRRPDVNNRDEYRHPNHVAPPDRRDYRIGFRRGYEVGVRNIYGPRYGRFDRY